MTDKLTISRTINNTMIVLAVAAFFLQIPIDDTSENLAAACIALAGSMCALCYFRYTNSFQTHPFSTFAIFGFCSTTQLGALLVQSFTWNSLSHYLRQPIETFAILGFYLGVAICAHATYRYFSGAIIGTAGSSRAVQAGPLRNLLNRLNFYAEPPVVALWATGLVGLAAVVLTGGSSGDQDVSSRISSGFSFLAWAPFMIPIYRIQIGPHYCRRNFHYALLILYTFLIGLLGIVANARSMMVAGATTIALLTLLVGMRSTSVASPKRVAQAISALLACGVLLVPLSNLATAMVVVREGHRSKSAINMLYATIDALTSERSLDRIRNREKYAALDKPYDEYYVDNPILARFVNTKFHDNSLYFESRLDERAKHDLLRTSEEMFWGILPDPALKALDVRLNKKSLRFSMGDYLLNQATGQAVGGYKYGSVFANGIGLFGMLFPIVYFGICLLSFWILDLFTRSRAKGEIVMSIVGPLLMWRMFFYGVTSDALHETAKFLLREIPQSIIIYLLVSYLLRLVAWPLVVMQPAPAQVRTSGSAS